MQLTSNQIKKFQQTVYTLARDNYRHFPWRATNNPYHILVSEIMLQQTQADRVTPKYRQFIKQFPTVQKLATAPLSQVLKAWQGLGYNRRAKLLWQAARRLTKHHGGTIPKDQAVLQTLPGIGPYTAAAISVFAFNQPVAVIETNIRSVFIHQFFPRRKTKITDAQLLPLISQTIDIRYPRRWYTALMDYGAWLKHHYKNPGQRSAHYVRQTTFVGSNRQLRGAIIRHLTVTAKSTKQQLTSSLSTTNQRLSVALNQLVAEQLVKKSGRLYRL